MLLRLAHAAENNGEQLLGIVQKTVYRNTIRKTSLGDDSSSYKTYRSFYTGRGVRSYARTKSNLFPNRSRVDAIRGDFRRDVGTLASALRYNNVVLYNSRGDICRDVRPPTITSRRPTNVPRPVADDNSLSAPPSPYIS